MALFRPDDPTMALMNRSVQQRSGSGQNMFQFQSSNPGHDAVIGGMGPRPNPSGQPGLGGYGPSYETSSDFSPDPDNDCFVDGQGNYVNSYGIRCPVM